MSDNKETALTTRIEVENLVVNPHEKRELAIGDTDSFGRVAIDTKGIQAVLWNEEAIVLVTKDPSTIITFRPELNPSVAMFFSRENKRLNDREASVGIRVWEGDYEPVRFTKANLLKFLKQYSQKDDANLVESIQELRVTESRISTEKVLSLDDENFSNTEEQRVQTNIPTKFSLEMPLVEGGAEKLIVTLDFEASVVRSEDNYGADKGKKYIQLRCTNARQVLHNLMDGYTELLPKNIPKYYGKLSLQALRNI